MSNTRFNVEILAIDRFSKIFRDLNDHASKATRPIQNVYRQVGALSKEMHLDKFAVGMERVNAASQSIGRGLGVSLGPLESLFTLGRAGGAIGVLTVAGGAVAGLATHFAHAGFEVSRTANALGLSTDLLQKWRGAAKQTGVSAEAIDGAFRGLADSTYRAFFDGDAAALQALQVLRIDAKKAADGSLDLNDAMLAVARAMQRVSDPHTRRRIAEALSIPEDAIPLLQRGKEGIESLAAKTSELGAVAGPKALAWASNFETSLNRLKIALEGVALRTAESLIPSLPGLVDRATTALSPPKGAVQTTGPRYPHGGTRPPAGLFDPLVGWWNDFDQASRDASPRGGHRRAAAAALPASAASAAAAMVSGAGASAPVIDDPLFDLATRRLTGPRDVEREREAFYRRIDIAVKVEAPPGHTATSKATLSEGGRTTAGAVARSMSSPTP
jgi:hypothetical protein